MRFCYINTRNIYPHDRHIIDGLRQNGHIVEELLENSPGWKKYLNLAKKLKGNTVNYDASFIGFTSPLFVPIAFLFGLRKIIFNATSSQYEANVISRMVKPISFQALKWWLVDFVSFHLPWRVLLESSAQIDYIRRTFLVSKKHLLRSWSGLNEKEFFRDFSIAKSAEFTVLFRGRFLTESGIDTVIKAAKILENQSIKFLIIGHGFMHEKVDALLRDLHPRNIELVSKTMPIDELRRRMQECHISLGQMADHPRLDRTLPCKSFESLALGLPYLTGRNKAILELLTENKDCLCSRPGDPKDLARKIIEAKNHPEILEKIAVNGYKLYQDQLTSRKLAADLINKLFPNQ